MESTQAVTFKSGDGLSVHLSAELNEEKNEGKNEFAFESGVCWINLFGSDTVNPEATMPKHDCSFGLISGGVVIMVEKEVKISMENKFWFDRNQNLSGGYGIEIIDASFLGKGILGSLSTKWMQPYKDGKPDGDSVLAVVNSGGPLLGELTVRYKVQARLYKITDVPKPDGYDDDKNPGLYVVALFSQYGSTATVTATFKNIGADAPRKVKLKIVNHCTDAPVPGAIVTLGGGLLGGVTGDDGMIDIGMVSPGTYPVIDIVKSGFEPPATDTLDNEEIQIPEETS